MEKRIRVTAISKPEPEVRLYVLALIALVRQLEDEQDPAKPALAADADEEATDERD